MSTLTIQNEINGALIATCDMSRNLHIDPRSYMDYVIAMLFLKYISDAKRDQLEPHTEDASTSKSIVPSHFMWPTIADFWGLHEKRHQSGNAGRINQALSAIEEANSELMGVFQGIRFSSAKLGNESLSDESLRHLFNHFATTALDLRPSRIGSINVIGNAYEYLIAAFASRFGKHFSESYTPRQVSELLAQLLRPQQDESIYDPACGSGGLLLSCARSVHAISPNGNCALYGQEKIDSTLALAKLNMFLHGEDNHRIVQSDALRNPMPHDERGGLMQFDVVLANPPFSMEWASEGAKDDPYGRFHRGLPPKTKADYAFILHMAASLKPHTGRMAVVVPHGVLFRGGVEGEIRRQLVEENLLDAVIGMPAKLFIATAISVAILVFRRDKTDGNVMFIDASRDYKENKIQNQLGPEHAKRILDTYSTRLPVEKYARNISLEEIRANDYNLSIPRYIDTSEEEKQIDILPLRAERLALRSELAEIESRLETYLENVRSAQD